MAGKRLRALGKRVREASDAELVVLLDDAGAKARAASRRAQALEGERRVVEAELVQRWRAEHLTRPARVEAPRCAQALGAAPACRCVSGHDDSTDRTGCPVHGGGA